jgi:RNA-binding protein YlmH
MMNQDKDEQILRRRLFDLAGMAYSRGICVFSDFLNLNEQNIFISMKNELIAVPYSINGGFSAAERRMVCFLGDRFMDVEQEIPFPITCIQISPVNQKFSDDLSHRDFLGAVINLGIDRSKLGDILIQENEGYLFCHTSINQFIIDNLIKVKHTNIKTAITKLNDFIYKPRQKEITGTVSSVRLDSILSVAFHSSRSSLIGLIEGGKVFVNSKVILSNSYVVKENDVVSVRGMGRFVFKENLGTTKKGRYSVKILLYV